MVSNGTNLGIEQKLWQASDKMRNIPRATKILRENFCGWIYL